MLFVLSLVVMVGCEKEYESIQVEDERNIQEYISRNGLNMQQYDTTGIYYSITKTPTGPPLDYTEQLPLIYTVKTLDGSFSREDTIANHYGGYFGYYSPAALREVVMANLKNQGGSIRIIVPSRKAYGRNGNTSLGIPGNASLDYTVTVLDKSKLKEYEDAMIRNFISREGLTGFTKTEDNIYYKISAPGTGETIHADSVLTINYTGRLLNGTEFETREGGLLGLSQAIQGWQKIIPLIKVGGSVRFILPSQFGYGLEGSNTIPGFSPLDFDVTVTDQTD